MSEAPAGAIGNVVRVMRIAAAARTLTEEELSFADHALQPTGIVPDAILQVTTVFRK